MMLSFGYILRCCYYYYDAWWSIDEKWISNLPGNPQILFGFTHVRDPRCAFWKVVLSTKVAK